MCDRIVVLARLDHRRWISCCEHGTTQLAWDAISIRLPVQRLAVMSKALQECAQVALRLRIAATDEVCVILDQYDLYQVWFGGIGLCLSPEDFQLFCRLLEEGSRHPTVQSGYQAVANQEGSIRTTYHLFSLN